MIQKLQFFNTDVTKKKLKKPSVYKGLRKCYRVTRQIGEIYIYK